MRSMIACLVIFGGVVAATGVSAQNTTAPPASTDVDHLHFAKAAPGQAAALAKSLMTPDKTSTMPEHFIVLRHQEGDDWDYVVIQHLGSKAEVTATAPAPSDAVRALTAWHNDTFVSGPSWGVFSKEMSIGGSADSASLVYIVGVHRAVPGHREQLLTSLNAAGPWNKIQTGDVLLQHLEGSEWTGQRIRFEVGVRLDLARCRERASDQHPDRRRRRSAALLAEHGVRAAAGTPSGPRRRVGNNGALRASAR